MTTENIVITGFAIEVPGIDHAEALLTPQPLRTPAEFDPKPILGRRGLRYKDRATKLALCAAQKALAHAGLAELPPDEARTTGVLVSSSLGNVDTVCQAVQTIREHSVRHLSPMSLPNLSSNNIASSIAIRFGLQAINLTLCNGSAAGTEAVYLAAIMLRAGRARRILLTGVEPRNEMVQSLMEASWQQEDVDPAPVPPIGEGAACIVLEREETAVARGATHYATVSDYTFVPPGWELEAIRHRILEKLAAPPQLWLMPNTAWPAIKTLAGTLFSEADQNRPVKLDLSHNLGELYSTLGVLQCVAACLWLQQVPAPETASPVVLATSGGTWGDGLASVSIRR